MSLNADLVYVCQRCGAGTLGAWPHPLGKPCPLAADAEAAYIAKLEADRAAAEATREAQGAMRDYYERAGMPVLDTGEAMRTMTRFFNREMGDDDE